MIYAYKHVFSDEVIDLDFPIGEAPGIVKRGKKAYQKIIQASVSIPPYMRAEGSAGSSESSCERQAKYLSSQKHRDDMKKSEAISQQTERVEASFAKKMSDAKPKLEEARKDDAVRSNSRGVKAQPSA